MKTGFQEFDLTFKAVDCIIPPSETDLAKEKEGGSVKRRVVAITEGKWNGTVFRPDEIDQIPANTEKRRGRDNSGTYNVPLVLDHSDDFLKRVGDTFNIQTGAVKGKNGEDVHGLILDHEFRQITSVQKDTVACVRDKPEETLFSIRARGKLDYDDILKEEYWTELSIEHDSIVTDPACPNTGIVGELSLKSDPHLNTGLENPSGMGNEDFEKRLDIIEQSIEKISTHIEKQISDQAAKDQAAAQEDVLERADTIAEIFALDPEVNRAFLKTLDKEQLKEYKKDLDRRQPSTGEPAPDGKGQAAGANSTAALSLEQKAEKFLEGSWRDK